VNDQRSNQQSTLASADFYKRGEYSQCLSELRHDNEISDLAMYLRCLIRLGRYSDVIRPDIIDRVRALGPREEFEVLPLVASAQSRLRMHAMAREGFERVRVIAEDLGVSGSDRAEFDYLQGLHFVDTGDLEAANTIAKKLFCHAAWRGVGLELEAWIWRLRGDQMHHVQLLDRALTHSKKDPWVRAAILHCLSAQIRELHLPQLVDRVTEIAEQHSWSADMATQAFYTFRNIGCHETTAARPMRACDRYHRAATFAQHKPSHKLLILADEAFLALTIDDRKSIQERMDAAAALVDKISWADCGESRNALLLLAELSARLNDVPTAERYLKRYTSTLTPIASNPNFGVGETLQANLECHTRAWIKRASGDTQGAIALFEDALARWKEQGARWRAVLAAIALGELTESDEYFAFARSETQEHFPHAWFARGIVPHSRRMDDPVFKSLTNTQRNILKLVIQGKRNKEIASELFLASNTVRSRLSELFSIFVPDQPNRTTLAAKMREYGL